MSSLWLAFLTGLTTGGLSCIAVQGGLLTSAMAAEEQNALGDPSLSTFQKHWKFILVFLITKVISYTLLGALLGLLGSAIGISLHAQGILQIFVGVFMFITAARLLDIHPFFRYFVLTPPKSVYKFLRRFSKEGGWITPAVLGFFTLFIPCGVTQVMLAGAIATGNPLMGALLLFAFTLGTSPIFFLIGMTVGQLLSRPLFVYIAVVIMLFSGVTSINGGLTLTGSPYTLENFYKVATSSPTKNSAVTVTNGKQEVTMLVSDKYEANVSTLKAGVPVSLHLKTEHAQGCIRAFTIPSMNLTKILPETGEELLEFTPTKPGRLSYSCNMGMYSGEFNVVM